MDGTHISVLLFVAEVMDTIGVFGSSLLVMPRAGYFMNASRPSV